MGMLMGYAAAAVLALTAFNPTALAAPTAPGAINYQGRLLNASNLPLAGNYDFRFSTWQDNTILPGDIVGGVLNCVLPRCTWNEVQTTTTDTYGLFNIQVGSVTPLPSLNVNNEKYLQIEVKPTASPITAFEPLLDSSGKRKPLNSFPYANNAETLDNANIGTAAGDIPALGAGGLLNMSMIPGGTNADSFQIDADHNAVAPIGLQFGAALSAILSWDPNGVAPGNGWFNFADDVNVQGNLTVTGTINGSYPNQGAKFVGTTVATTNGNFASGGKIGYEAATVICNAEFAGSHLCTSDNIMNTIAYDNASVFGAALQGWIGNGPPGYTSNSNDCLGWTSASGASHYGAFWVYDVTGGGKAWLSPCNSVKPLSCCE